MSLEFKIGKKIRLKLWPQKDFREILCIHKDLMWTINQDGGYETWTIINNDWEEYVLPKEKVKIDFWVNVYEQGCSQSHYYSKELAERNSRTDRLGQFHVVGEI